MKNILQFIFLLIVFSSSACSKGQAQGQNENIFDSLNGIDKNLYAYSRTQLDLFRLNTDSIGFDSIRIRVYFYVGPGYSTERLIELSFSKSKWKGILINYRHMDCLYEKNDEVIYSECVKKKKIRPKIKWDTFIKILIDNDILILPNYDQFQNYSIYISDFAIGYWVEITTRNSYRFYKYPNPKVNLEKFEEAKKMQNIINCLYSNLKIK